MLWLGLAEIGCRFDFGHDFAGPEARCVDVGDGVERLKLLAFVEVIDSRAVGHAAIITLAQGRGWVVDLEEEFEQLAVAGFGRIKDDFDPFRMGAVVAVGGIRHVAARIAHACGHHAVKFADQVLHAPKAAACENCALIHLNVLHLIDKFAVAFGLHVSLCDEPQAGGVDAVAQAATIAGAVVEDVAKVAVAVFRADFDADHAVGAVGQLFDMRVDDWLGEARPAAAAIEFVG